MARGKVKNPIKHVRSAGKGAAKTLANMGTSAKVRIWQETFDSVVAAITADPELVWRVHEVVFAPWSESMGMFP